jgi:Spy/CpxP family protein refolding chaperone
LERAFRQRTAEVVRRQLKLDDNQMSHLQATNQEFDRQRMALVADERQTRQALRAEMLNGDAANQQKVGTLLDQMLRLQRRRIDLQENEQRELGKFLTPVQRAKYFGLQAQLRKRMMELRDQPGAGAAQLPMQRRLARPGVRPNARRPFR